MIKIESFKESIEAIIGVQLACCIEWNIHNNDLDFNLEKLDEFSKGYGFNFFVNNQKYISGFMAYINQNFWFKIEAMIKLIPVEYAEFTIRRCANIICSSELENDIKLLQLIKRLINLPEGRSDEIIQEVIRERVARNRAEKLINIWGKNTYKEPGRMV